ncbi:MAG: RNA 2',3'-cyclic phosphodiesterase [Myxococcota bacterium]|nr:RNA 2',3'-cyclic phosphodiesterase [Myxococcota bacterium]
MKGTTIRAFVALDLDTTSVRRVIRVADRLRMGSGAPSATWTSAPKLHLTLKFMEELATDAAAPLATALRALAEGKAAPAPCAFRLDAFPSVEEARIVVVELADRSGELSKLADRVAKLCAKHGVPREEQPLRPHVTLARLKRPYDARRWIRPDLAERAGDCKASHLTLYQSEPATSGAVYTPLARFRFDE